MLTYAPNANSPRPPFIPDLLDLPDSEEEVELEPLFVPDLGVARWVDDHFLNAESELLITDHADLVGVPIGFVWTNVVKTKQGSEVWGTAELGVPSKQIVRDDWVRGAIRQQRREWFGSEVALLVHLWAPFCARAPALAVAALIDHELRHFRQRLDKDGEPIFDEETGLPSFRIVGHSLEEFTGTALHFGAWEIGLSRMRQALNDEPLLDLAAIERAVGPPLIRDGSYATV